MKKATLFWSLAVIGAGIISYFAVLNILDSQSAWYWRHVSFIALGLVISLGMIFGSTPQRLFRLSKLPYGSPNWLSLQRIWIIFLGQWTFFEGYGNTGRQIAGFALVVFGMTLDRLDGKQNASILASLKKPEDDPNSNNSLAWYHYKKENEHGEIVLVTELRILEDWIRKLAKDKTILPMFLIDRDLESKPHTFHLYLTYIGDWLDPLSDKINFLPLFCYLAYRDMLYWPVVTLMVSSDIFSTIIREPFLSIPGFGWMQKHVRETKSGPVGKTKVVWQFLTLLAIIPAASNWLSPAELHSSKIIASSLLGIGVIVGILSTTSRLIVWNSLIQAVRLRGAYRRFKKGYEHEVKIH